MRQVSLEEAQAQLAELCWAAVNGETIIIFRDDGRAVQLVPITVEKTEKKARKPGSAKGQIWMSDDFDAPLDDFKDYIE